MKETQFVESLDGALFALQRALDRPRTVKGNISDPRSIPSHIESRGVTTDPDKP